MKLSVCVPVYKMSPFIEKCARSLFEQTLEDIEFIFIDDCTPDDSITILEDVLRDYPSRQKDVKIVRHEKNSGLVRSRKTGLAVATGEFVTHCDADDWIDLDLYEKMVSAAERSAADMVFCPLVHDDEPKCPGMWDKPFDGSGSDFYELAGKIMGFYSTVNKVYRRSIIDAHPVEVPDQVRIGEDMCRTMQTVWQCRRVVSVIDSVYHYRRNVTSMSLKFDHRRSIEDLMAIYEVFERNLPSDVARKPRQFIAYDILFTGMRLGVLSGAEHALWRRRYRTYGDLPLPPPHFIKRMLLFYLVLWSYSLSRIVFRCLRWRRFKGFQ